MNDKLIWTLGILSVVTLIGAGLYGNNNASAQDLSFQNLKGSITNLTNEIVDTNPNVQREFHNTRINPYKDTKIEVDELKIRVNTYVKSINENLEVADIFVYENSDYYFSIEEKDTGKGAMELLVDPYTGEIYPEYGPSMMWNEKYDLMHGDYGTTGGRYGHMGGYSGMMGGSYGHMGGRSGMMGGRYGRTDRYSGMRGGDYGRTNDYTGNVDEYYGRYPGMMDGYYENNELTNTAITRTEAIELANDYVQSVNTSLSVPSVGHEFYGYYTFHIENNGEVVDMLSVHIYTGDVWYHNWHGTIVDIISHHNDELKK
ncbi:hypothetical protein [Haloplasma contractile]|uniref:PepSY domain-containing protein n=1 Tax=Haloplasma contractile SSD-17B TaxID=1033810 RepID=F7PW90_9MOLU|nr:hypothetical protein [Haloplasma contractile]ERJ11252.1 hypothetical protein HLPCO_002692 [Haloplasma contractile SSD-17B]